MARRKSHQSNEENVKERRGPIQYPYVVYASKEGPPLKWLILKFTSAWGARNMIHQLIGRDTYEWKKMASVGWNYMLTSNGINISLRHNGLNKEVMELEFNEAESFMSPEVRYFLHGPSESHRAAYVDSDLPKHSPVAKSRRERASGEPKERKAKVDRTGYVSANEIAAQLGVPGRDVRGILRTLKLQKPVRGWCWPKDEAEEIKKKIEKGLKAKAKK